jgi:hypothetical protein
MLGRQENGEAIGRWRRVQPTSTQLSTYYVGYCQVRDLVRDLCTDRRTGRAGRYTMSCGTARHGSPPVRRLRTLVLA